eukprot:1148879-Pelagomonas_calceolata.AAC.2
MTQKAYCHCQRLTDESLVWSLDALTTSGITHSQVRTGCENQRQAPYLASWAIQADAGPFGGPINVPSLDWENIEAVQEAQAAQFGEPTFAFWIIRKEQTTQATSGCVEYGVDSSFLLFQLRALWKGNKLASCTSSKPIKPFSRSGAESMDIAAESMSIAKSMHIATDRVLQWH